MEEKIFKRAAVFLAVLGSFVFGFFTEAQTFPSAIDYAPNLWFDSQEKYYPANPLDFYFENGQEIEGEKAVKKYNQLSLPEKLERLTVFYHIKDKGTEWVYQYWFFYILNDSQGTIKNQHYGDWEAVFVFVDKESSRVNKVIGTAHQRKLFDTEIEYPQTNHIWAYIGNGSHANCVDEEGDGICSRKRWKAFEKWDQKGSKVLYNNYKLIEISDDFINNFKGATGLEKSTKLGINLFDYIKVSNKKLYIPLGGNPSTYAWEQPFYHNPEKVRPISRKLIAEYISSKFNQIKDKIVGFFSEQEAGIITLLDDSAEVKPDLAKVSFEEIESLQRSDLKSTPISEPVETVKEEIIKKIEIIKEEVIEIEEVKIIEEIEIVIPSPIRPPPFIGSGGAFVPPKPEPEAEIIDTIPPSDITDLSAEMGGNRGQINLSWTSPGADEYMLRYSTSSVSWASSTDIVGEPSPGAASSTESFSISNLNVSQTYYWVIKSQDAVGNLSGISNSASSSPYAAAENLVISEIAVRGPNGAKDEFIEIYNPTDRSVNLADWSLQYASAQATTTWQYKYFLVDNNFSKELPNVNLASHQYYLLTSATSSNYYSYGMRPDLTAVTMAGNPTHLGLANDGGKIRLLNNQEEVIDLVAWGQNSLGAEGNPLEVNGFSWGSIERKNNSTSTAVSLAVGGSEHWNGNNWDMNNNSLDFVLQATTSPQNSLSLTEPRNSFASLASTDWPMLQGDLQHTGLSPYGGTATGSPTSTPKWTAILSTLGPNAPVIGSDGSVYIGTGSGKLYRITATGTSSIFYDVGVNGNIEAPVIASDGTVYITDRKDLYALTSDGRVIWKYPIYGFSAPAIALDGTIYIASSYYLFALTPNGQKIWQSPGLSNGRWIKSPLLDSDGNIYLVGKFGSCSGCQRVYALNPSDGSIIWQTDPGSYYTALSLDGQGVLYVGSFSGGSSLHAINSSDGDQKWYVSIGGILGSIPAINQDVIYVGTYNNGMVYSVDIADGSVNWIYYLGGKISASPIIDSQGVIYIGSKNNMFYALNSDGSLKWLAELSDEVQHSAVIDSNGVVYVGVADGTIYAFGE